MSAPADWLVRLATSVADGAPVDWAAVSGSASSDLERYEIEALEALTWMRAVHRAPRSPHAAPLPDLPCRWGPLEVTSAIGAGTFGTVYQARDLRLDREVALKLLHVVPGDSAVTPEYEGRLLARVTHPNVVAVYGVETIDGQTGLWMERLHGESLAARIRRDGALTEEQTTDVGIQVCRALGAVHDAGLLHRDIKAQNVICEASGRMVLTDFGTGLIATAALPSAIAGTPLYIAPEVLDGAAPSVASDIYSVGVLLFYASSGRFPASASSIVALRHAHAAGTRLRLSDCRPDLSRRFTAAVDRALATDPSSRFPDARSLETALTAVAGGLRRRVLAAAVLLLLALAIGLVAYARRDPVVPAHSYAGSIPPGRYSWDVTSPSPVARRLYRDAHAVFFSSMSAAERRVREAIAADSQFASGHNLLAWTIRNQGGDEQEVQQHTETARRLSAGLPEVERLFIVGSYHELRKEWKPAITAYERLLGLDPDHFWALLNLSNAYAQTEEDSPLLLELWTSRARRYPGDVDTLNGAARALALKGDWELATAYARACLRLAPDRSGWWPLAEAYNAWMRDRPDQMRVVLERVKASRDKDVELARTVANASLAAAYMDLGQLGQARALFADRPRDEWGPYQHLALVEWARHDGEAALVLMQRHVAARELNTFPAVWPLYFDLPLVGHGRALSQREDQSRFWDERLRNLLHAELLALEGRQSEARPLLADAIGGWRRNAVRPVGLSHGGASLLRASILLSRVELADGRLDRAIDVLEDGTQDRARACFFYQADGYVWLELRAELARLYVKAGRRDEAGVVAEQVRRLMVFADDDHPLKWFDPVKER